MSTANGNHGRDELLSPYSRVFLCPKMDQVINCAMGLGLPIDLNALKKAFSDSVMIEHPRFCSLLVRDHTREYWRKTCVNIDDHFIIQNYLNAATTTTNDCDVGDDVEAAVNAYMADLAVANPLRENKPLWEVHVLIGLNCVVLRFHHALGDGVSLMSMLSACFGKKRDGVEKRENGEKVNKAHGERKWRKRGLWGLVKSIWLTLLFMVKTIGKFLWVKDDKCVISGGEGVELWPRKLETVKFDLQDLKSIKEVISNVTVNDVMLGIISSGLSKYLLSKSPDALQQGLQLTAVLPVNLRKSSGLQELSDMMRANTWWWGKSSWGNKIGTVLQPVHCCKGLHPLDHVKRMKATMDQKKQSYEAQVLYILMQLIVSCFGPEASINFGRRLTYHTTLVFSNIVGPSEEMAIGGNPITYIRVNLSSVAYALVMHMVSYAGKADLQMMVAKDIIPDPQFLAQCFQESLLEMKCCIGDSKV